MIVNQFELGDLSREVIVSTEKVAFFEDLSIRNAGATYAKDKYLCARKQPKHHVLLYCCSGLGKLKSRDKTVLLKPTNVVLLQAEHDFIYELAGEHWTFCWFILEAKPKWQHIESLPMQLSDSAQNINIKHMLCLLDNDISAASRQSLQDEMRRYIEETLRMRSQQQPVDRLQQLFYEVDQHINYPWNTQRMAETIHVSEATLHRLCRAAYQQSPKQVLIEKRLKRCRVLLSDTDWSLQVIATQLGYKDGFSLSKAFKKLYGISPADFRKGHSVLLS